MRSQSMSVTQVSYSLLHSSFKHHLGIHSVTSFFVLPFVQAIKIFSEARPPGIYKPDYIDALYAFYHERRPEMVVCPSTPEWKRSSDLDLNGDAVADDDDDDGGGGPAALPVWMTLQYCCFFIPFFFCMY